jgi:CRP-like cAMP-binding protein
MPANPSQATQNRLLFRLSAGDFALLSPHLKRIDLPVRRMLEFRDKPIDKVYFPESGFASVVANGSSQRSIEVGLIGREGMTGLPITKGDVEHHTERVGPEIAQAIGQIRSARIQSSFFRT